MVGRLRGVEALPLLFHTEANCLAYTGRLVQEACEIFWRFFLFIRKNFALLYYLLGKIFLDPFENRMLLDQFYHAQIISLQILVNHRQLWLDVRHCTFLDPLFYFLYLHRLVQLAYVLQIRRFTQCIYPATFLA